ncbi:MAG TPA: aminotransferase class V-fold PLP-dependent enzyme [Blastocatellia bacterium]|nr:aminotransferase class V-fold PLP-dependent enzyme [Blastocatellia bacterium]
MHKTDISTQKTLEAAFRHSSSFLENLDHRPVGATVDLNSLRERLGKPLADASVPPDQVIDEMVRDVEGGILGFQSGRFFGWVVGGGLPAALAADWLTSTWDQNAVLYASGPAAAIVEEVTGEWLKEILGLPAVCTFAFTTGCQMAHTTCLAAARHALLARNGYDVERDGLYNAPPIRILTSNARHGSVERAVRMLGLGASNIIDLEVDESGQLQPETLEAALSANSSSPIIVLLQAGDINTGVYDSFETLIPVAKKYNAWVHIDGAFGLWAAASSRYRHLTKGVEKADSWATDGHKWLNVPFDSGYAFIADAEAHKAAMSYRASYLVHGEEARDPFDWNPEWSRRSRGFSSYAALRQLGRSGVAELIERSCQHALSLVDGIGKLPSVEVLWRPIINQGLVRFLDSSPNATEEDHDRRTDKVIAAIVATGEAFFGGTTWRGRRAMRVSVCNWRTTEEDVRRTIDAVANVLRKDII